MQSAILCVSLRKIRGQRSKRMVISSLGCVCFHFAHVCADKVWLAKKSQSRAGFRSSCSPASFRNDGKSCTLPLVTAQTDGGNQWLVDMLQYTEISPHRPPHTHTPNPSIWINSSTWNTWKCTCLCGRYSLIKLQKKKEALSVCRKSIYVTLIMEEHLS